MTGLIYGIIVSITILVYVFYFYRLSTINPLDREQRPEYNLTILASEDCVATPAYDPDADAVSSLTVLVTVNDVNDNAPRFKRKIFTGGVTTEADFGIEFMHVKVSTEV